MNEWLGENLGDTMEQKKKNLDGIFLEKNNKGRKGKLCRLVQGKRDRRKEKKGMDLNGTEEICRQIEQSGDLG